MPNCFGALLVVINKAKNSSRIIPNPSIYAVHHKYNTQCAALTVPCVHNPQVKDTGGLMFLKLTKAPTGHNFKNVSHPVKKLKNSTLCSVLY